MDLDGSYGEGGGQVLRTALTLSVLTGQPLRITRIRAGRRKPGLQPQHLTSVRAAAKICNARVEGDRLESQELAFTPQSPPQAGTYTFDVSQASKGGSAGAISLILQTVLLPLALAAGTSQLTLRGGTHVAWSPPFDYLKRVYLPVLARMGISAKLQIEKWGWYPIGGGEVKATIEGVLLLPRRSGACPRESVGGGGVGGDGPLPCRSGGGGVGGDEPLPCRSGGGGVGGDEPLPCRSGGGRVGVLRGLDLSRRGQLLRVRGISASSNLPKHIRARQEAAALQALRSHGLNARIDQVDAPSKGQGTAVFLWAESENAAAGFSSLGALGKPAERVAEEAARDLLAYLDSGAALDRHLADQLVLPMALASGPSHLTTEQVTQHLLTVAWVVNQCFPGRVQVEGDEGQPGSCHIRPS